MKNALQPSIVVINLVYHVKKVFVSVVKTLIGRNRNAVRYYNILNMQLYRFFIIFNWNFKAQAKINKEKCAAVEECDGTKNLTCKEGVCECLNVNLYWNEKDAKCGKMSIIFQSLLKLLYLNLI